MTAIGHNPYSPLRKSWMCCRCQLAQLAMAGRRKTPRGWVCLGCQQPKKTA
jgi:hypothetical protein